MTDTHAFFTGLMRHRTATTLALLMALVAGAAGTTAGQTGLPLKNGRPAVAMVNGDPVYLDELVTERGSSANTAALRRGIATEDDLAQVDRLITIRLIVQEATSMGLAELPELQKQIDVTAREILREVLIERLVKDVKPDPKAVEALFQDAVREWRTASLLFLTASDAQAARKELASGVSFDDLAKRAVAAKTAKADADSTFHPKTEYLPQIGNALATLRAGQISPVLPLPSGFAIVKVVDVRYPENAEARASARQQVLSQQQVTFLEAHEQDLRRQYVVVNASLLKGIDYTAEKPALEDLLADKRVVAQVTGGDSLTIADLTDYLRMQFFHGSDDAAQRKKMTDMKQQAFDAMVGRRLLNAEAARLGIDKTNAYRDRLRGFTESLVFGTFVDRVIAPENKVTDSEVLQYYITNLKDYSYPGMLRLRSLALTRRNAAEDAVRKLREGADFNWLAANADGRAPAGTKGLLSFDGQPVITTTMPDALQKALMGAKDGEFRLYEDPGGLFYVLAVQQVIGATAKPFQEVREEAAKNLYAEKLKKGIEREAAALRARATVETYLKRARP